MSDEIRFSGLSIPQPTSCSRNSSARPIPGAAHFAALVPEARADFIDAVAGAILAIGDDLIETAIAETGLPRGRLENERGRTVGRLTLFAADVRAGEWLDVTIDRALPGKTVSRADLRAGCLTF
jgi:2,5-dioxopentanoate dehydrogenase